MSDRSWVRRAVLFLAVWGASGCESGEKQVQAVLVVSPSGDVRMTVSTDTEGRMTYSVTRNGQVEIESSPLGFLDAGTYELALIEQGDTPDAFERSVQSVEAGASVTITLPANGGFVATVTPR